MAIASPAIHTVGTLALSQGVPIHRILYIIRSRGIRPFRVAGNVRLFDDAAAQRIGSELRRIADEREPGR